MKRKKSQDESINWKYGCKSPRGEGAEILRQQMREAHNYRNKLVELELLKRQEFYDLERELFPEYADLQEQEKQQADKVEDLRKQWKKANARARTRTEQHLLKAQIAEEKQTLKDLRARMKEMKEQVRNSEELKERSKQIKKRHYQRLKDLRAETPAFWGNVGFVDQAAQSMASGSPPKYYRWEGEGFIGVSFRTPITPEVLMSGRNTRAWLEPCKTANNKAGRVKKTTLHIAVESENRKLKMASLPIYFHRDFPDGCEITSVRVFCKKVGQREEWSAVFQLRSASFAKPDAAADGMAAIHFGWRRVDDGLRVASVVDEDGTEEVLILPESIIDSYAYVKDIQAIRDYLWNETIAILSAFLKQHSDSLPEPVKEASQNMHLWKGRGRLVHLINVWSDHRFPGDEEMFLKLTRKGTPANEYHDSGWLHRDKHLWDIEANVRDNAALRRKALYREFAAKMRRKYRHLITAKLDLKKIVSVKNPEEEDDAAMKHHSRVAAIHSLQAALSDSMRDGWIVVPAAKQASTCHECGAKFQDDSGDAYISCENCGSTFDREFNACKNLLFGPKQVNAAPALV